MYIGVTQIKPRDWHGRTGPRNMRNSWCINTLNGYVRIDCEPTGRHTGWKEKFGDMDELTEGDTVSVTLNSVRSLDLVLQKYTL